MGRSVEQGGIVEKVIRVLPPGMKLSKGGVEVIKRVEGDVNPNYITGRLSAAASSAQRDGRSKIGLFGPTAACFDELLRTARIAREKRVRQRALDSES